MATQKRADGADLWFVTSDGTQKLRDLAADPHVNLSYYKDRTREWVSVSGIATITRDRQKIQQQITAWAKESGLPLVHISRICAMSIGPNYDAETLQQAMGGDE